MKGDFQNRSKGEYLDLAADTDGIVRSRVFPGLWLEVSPVLAGNMQGVLKVLQEGVQSPEHDEIISQNLSDIVWRSELCQHPFRFLMSKLTGNSAFIGVNLISVIQKLNITQ